MTGDVDDPVVVGEEAVHDRHLVHGVEVADVPRDVAHHVVAVLSEEVRRRASLDDGPGQTLVPRGGRVPDDERLRTRGRADPLPECRRLETPDEPGLDGEGRDVAVLVRA